MSQGQLPRGPGWPASLTSQEVGQQTGSDAWRPNLDNRSDTTSVIATLVWEICLLIWFSQGGARLPCSSDLINEVDFEMSGKEDVSVGEITQAEREGERQCERERERTTVSGQVHTYMLKRYFVLCSTVL